MDANPLVGVIMGSKSDWDTMTQREQNAGRVRRRVRNPHRLRASHAAADRRIRDRRRERGLEVIIAGAGGAAHLPGMTAATLFLPVLGVPIESKTLKGIDSLLSIVQMPAGIPVATLAHRQSGRDQRRSISGPILANSRPDLREKLRRVARKTNRARS